MKNGEHEVLMTGAEVCEHLRITRTTLWRWTRDGKFPPPVKLNGSVGRYRRQWLIDWEAEQEKRRGK